MFGGGGDVIACPLALIPRRCVALRPLRDPLSPPSLPSYQATNAVAEQRVASSSAAGAGASAGADAETQDLEDLDLGDGEGTVDSLDWGAVSVLEYVLIVLLYLNLYGTYSSRAIKL